ncbi:DNA recombination protein RmuC [Hydrogenimonas sp.]|nr:DNA recombination protein RmuC [Hydrogenimonas sp.]
MQIPLIWLYFSAGAAVGAAAAALTAFFIFRSAGKRYMDRIGKLQEAAQEKIEELEKSLSESKLDLSGTEEQLNMSRVENAALKERLERLADLEARNADLEEMLEIARSRNLELEKELSETNTRLDAERRHARKSIEELKESRESMQKEFKVLAAQIMEENSRRFGIVSKEGVEQVLKPLQQQVSEFKKRIEQVHIEETREMAALLNEIKTLKDLNRKISEDAVNLTRALKGDSKQQGIWGEMVLERVLEASGLREGEEYEREVSLQDTESRRFRPDVVIHLPGKRDIIVDAKTSLTAYERYVNEQDEERKKEFAKLHLEAVRNHIERLAQKSYGALEGVNSLDFIFMFMPIEGALMLALQSDSTLYDRAFSKKIVLVSPTTLLVALRAVENTWRHERQNRNAMEIANKAGALYDKFVGFANDLEKVGKQIETLQKSYDGAWKKLTEGRGNIVRRVEELQRLGARGSKSMPKRISDDAGLSEEKLLRNGDSSQD